MDFISGEKNTFVVYVSNDLYIHRTKLEQADHLYEEQAGGLLSPAPEDTKGERQALSEYGFTIKEKHSDIVFSGLGWITVHHAPCKLKAYAPEGVEVSIRQSIIKG